MSITAHDRYVKWLNHPDIDDTTKTELLSVQESRSEIEDRFACQLEFGTGGMRGIMGAGTNRINIYNIVRVTTALAHYTKLKSSNPSVVIAYDTRHNSALFAQAIAATLTQHNISAYVFENTCPTPVLSFAVRQMEATAGVVITASHNPPQYNGYKAYSEDGVQLTPDSIDQIIEILDSLPEIIAPQPKEKENYLIVPDELLQEYNDRVIKTMLRPEITSSNKELKVTYTPLQGVGAKWVPNILEKAGFNIEVVTEQMKPDPYFKAVSSTNPEDEKAYKLALQYAKQNNSDLILATDPDVDRVGVMTLQTDNSYKLLNGNQVGSLLLDYLLSTKTLPKHGVLIQSIVTGRLSEKIAQKYGVEIIKTLTGFKYIGEQMTLLEQQSEKQFLFGFEESCGYLAADFVRDKDGIMSALLIAEMALYHKQNGKRLTEALEQLYLEHGYFQEHLENITFRGIQGQKEMASILDNLRQEAPNQIGNEKIEFISDYLELKRQSLATNQKNQINLPQENILQYELESGSTITLRPSGTEPKLKIYLSSQGKTKHEAQDRLDVIKKQILKMIH